MKYPSLRARVVNIDRVSGKETGVEDDTMVLVVQAGKLAVKPQLEDRQCLETSEALQLRNSCDVEHGTAVEDHIFDGVQLETP